jgi:hypothetical protein
LRCDVVACGGPHEWRTVLDPFLCKNSQAERAAAPFAHADSGANMAWTNSTISAGAFVGEPVSYGGCGSYSIANWTL